ncbi:hypothetical protein Agub_g6624 [Astrephomene gubernaculifera]|uniref:Uncharacterized protein n=1 Tax=Astrephomene gubernaculifera TaxID=47775 RepID=A0AAD3DQR2_9CHLO|nr:hypothetical protein Agub_g6624 [Astrephomene gubernaculifera]
MKVDFTLKRFPINGRLKEQCGLPFSAVLQPYHKLSERDAAAGGASEVASDDIARCKHCYAYVNCYCAFDTAGWVCSLCNKHNSLKPQQMRRYRLDPAHLQQLPEVRCEVFEALAEHPAHVHLPGQQDQGFVSGPAPTVLALVDTSAGEEFLELVRSSLEAALEALPPVTRFGLITMSHRIGLYDVRAPEPCVRYVPLYEPVLRPGSSPASSAAASPAVGAPLGEVLPLSALLAPVGAYKGAITRALEEQLQPEEGFGDSSSGGAEDLPSPLPGAPLPHHHPSSASSAAAAAASPPGQEAGMSRSAAAATTTAAAAAAAPAPAAAAGGAPAVAAAASPTRPLASRGVGPALVAVLDYLKVLQQPPFLPPAAVPGSSSGTTTTAAAAAGADHLPANPSPVKLLLFLAGPPDYGIGRLVNPRRRKAAAAAFARAQLAAAAAAVAAQANGSGSGSAATPPQPQPHADASAVPPPPPPPPSLPAPDPDAWIHDVPSSSVEFYQQAAAACASLGISVDLFAVCGGALGLRHLEPLAGSTGGAMYLYPAVEDSAMPQDVYLRLSAPAAWCGEVRLRTSPQFRVVRHYGRLLPDPTIPDLHHVSAADPSDAFAVDFDFTSPSGFSGSAASLPPTLQIAFRYTALVCVKKQQQPQPQQDPQAAAAAAGTGTGAAAAGAGGGGEVREYWLQRRLRVATYRVNVAATVADVYAHTQPEAVVTLLMHKIMRAAEAQGPHEARLLLRDWLVLLALNYHRNAHPNLTPQQLAAVPADLHFTQAPQLAPLPRLVYALLRSPLLAPPPLPPPPPPSEGASPEGSHEGGGGGGGGQHPDLTSFLRHLWGALPPGELVRAVYPVMQSYHHPDQLALPRHSLSRAALAGPDAPPIFLLDAYILILVYYTSRCPPELPFPPPQQSALRKAVAAIRSERRITPMVKLLREGSEEAELFDQLLLDEPVGHFDNQPPPQQADGEGGSSAPAASVGSSSSRGGSGGGGGGGGSSGFGLVQFLEHVQGEAALQLRHEAALAAQQR